MTCIFFVSVRFRSIGRHTPIKVLERQRDNETLPQNIMAINYAITELERVLAHIQHLEP